MSERLEPLQTAEETGNLSYSSLPSVSSAANGNLGPIGPKGELRGWAWDPTQPDRAVAVSFLEGSEVLGTVLADRPRADLAAQGKGNGKYGFSVPLPPVLRDGKPHSVHARIAGTQIELRNSPRIYISEKSIEAVPGVSKLVRLEVCPNPIFVLGCWRSGTNALAHALAQHSELWTHGESILLYPLFYPDRFTGAFQTLKNHILPTWVRKYDIEKLDFLRALGTGINALFTSKNAGKRWIDKTPEYTLIAPILADMFPGALFLHLIRDGRRVVHSMAHFVERFSDPEKSAFHKTLPAQHWATDFREACRTWQRLVRAGTKFCAQCPKRSLTVTNEQLVAERSRTFAEIYRFLDVPFEEEPINLFGRARIFSSFRSEPTLRNGFVEQIPYRDTEPWNEWTVEQRQIFAQEAGETLVEYGFASNEDMHDWQRAPASEGA